MPFVNFLDVLRNNQSQMLNEKKSQELPNALRATGFLACDSAGVVCILRPLDVLTLQQEIRVVRRSLSALTEIPYLFVADPSEAGSGFPFVQNMLGSKGQRVSWEGGWVQILPSGAADEVHGVAVASCLLLPLRQGQLNLLFLHHCTGDVSPVDLPIGQ